MTTVPSSERPAPLAAMSDEQCVELDVRSILRGGGEPFSDIMRAVGQVPEDGALRLRATFKPSPLFGVMRSRGWTHWIEYGQGDDWVIWFYRE